MSEKENRWWEQAACKDKDPEIFFAYLGKQGSPKKGAEQEAKKICAGCPVQKECLQDAFEEESRTAILPLGIRAGLTGRERKDLFNRTMRFR